MAKDASAALPHSLTKIKACLEGFQTPSGPFDPQGAWEHRYGVWVVLPESGFGKTSKLGVLALRREAAKGGGVALDVNLFTQQSGRGTWGYRVQARLVCAEDRLTTPRSWELRAADLDQTGKPTEGTQVQEVGEVAQGVIRRRGKGERTTPAPKSFTSNWSLFDAVQRFAGNQVEPMAFDLLEEMNLLKPNHRLTYRRSVEMELGGRATRLHGFDQIGEGIRPYEYWLDDQRRLLMAIGGLRAFILDPMAPLPEALP